MILVEAALAQILKTDARLNALVADRIYANVLRQDITYPAVAYRLRARERALILEPRGSAGFVKSRIAIFSAGEEYGDVKAVDEAIRLALHGFQNLVTIDLESFEIKGIFALTSIDFFDDTTQTHQVMSEFDVFHEEVQPT
jgi:hypothetical protein